MFSYMPLQFIDKLFDSQQNEKIKYGCQVHASQEYIIKIMKYVV